MDPAFAGTLLLNLIAAREFRTGWSPIGSHPGAVVNNPETGDLVEFREHASS
jgi:hypothetical protein